jgi:hypothetical protein
MLLFHCSPFPMLASRSPEEDEVRVQGQHHELMVPPMCTDIACELEFQGEG